MAIKLPSLRERIDLLRADIESYVDSRVAEIKLTAPGLPEQTIKNTIFRTDCHCRSYAQLIAKDAS